MGIGGAMIPVKENREVISGGVTDSVEMGISAADSAHVMTILRDTLYSDKIMAVLREYSSNAWDANREAGRGDVPIRVTLPTFGEQSLKIRDVGPGLSLEDIVTVYSQYGASTKRGSNSAVGMLGIGSKSCFAYSDSFTVTSWHGGKRMTYVAVIDSSEKGRIDLLHEEPCDPSETGVEIQISVKQQDIGAFVERAERLFVHFVPRPEINVDLGPPIVGRKVANLGTLRDDSNRYDAKPWIAVMGCVPYQIDLSQLSGVVDGVSLTKVGQQIGGLLPFEIGELQVAASREGLKYGDQTKVALIRRINDIIDEFVRTMLDGLDKLSNWEKRLRIQRIEGMSLPVPKHLQPLQENYASLKQSPTFFKCVTYSRYERKHSETKSIQVFPGAKLVIKDDRRAIGGYTLGDDTLVIPHESKTASGIRAELLSKLHESELDGIPIVNISSLSWVAPQRAPTGARDMARAKSRCFVLDPKAYFGNPSKTQAWLPVTRTASTADIFVVLESYRDANDDNFYESYRTDEKRFEALGLKMPEVIGYKSTVAFPVSKSTQKGTWYRDWRTAGMVEILMADNRVSQLVQALWLSDLNSHYRQLDSSMLGSALGDEHPIVNIAERSNEAVCEINVAPKSLTETARFVKQWAKRKDRDVSDTILSSYPLLKANGLQALVEVQRDLWIDYIKLVDSSKRTAGHLHIVPDVQPEGKMTA